MGSLVFTEFVKRPCEQNRRLFDVSPEDSAVSCSTILPPEGLCVVRLLERGGDAGVQAGSVGRGRPSVIGSRADRSVVSRQLQHLPAGASSGEARQRCGEGTH